MDSEAFRWWQSMVGQEEASTWILVTDARRLWDRKDPLMGVSSLGHRCVPGVVSGLSRDNHLWRHPSVAEESGILSADDRAHDRESSRAGSSSVSLGEFLRQTATVAEGQLLG